MRQSIELLGVLRMEGLLEGASNTNYFTDEETEPGKALSGHGKTWLHSWIGTRHPSSQPCKSQGPS